MTASIPSSSSDTPAETSGKPGTVDGGEGTQDLRDDGNADLRLTGREEKEKRRRPKKLWEGQKSDWWFASTGVPLLAATLGPLANVSSIAALVSSWRANIEVDGSIVSDFEGMPFADPLWCYWLNVASLICGFLGNLFLLLNFTQRIRYLIALPVTIISWYLSTGFLIGITACMQIYDPPNRPYETYTQGFWYAIAAAVFYLVCSMVLMVNMLGYFLGHYPDTFALTDAQRTLILQTMLFFIWLGGGAAAFSRIEGDVGEPGWEFADALYFCDVTILTVGFGDLYPTTDLGRGLVFPYSVGGTIILGLVISSIYKFVRQLGEDHIIQAHIDRMRERTVERTVTNSFDLRQREHEQEHHVPPLRSLSSALNSHLTISRPSNVRAYRTAMGNTVRKATPSNPLHRQRARTILLREEKDRFDAMRAIQARSHRFKAWYALIFSALAFGTLWCIGAIVFWQTEKNVQNMTYFRALYFCYVSLLTIGYGDLSPKTNAGRCFFLIWSLIAVPTMTILVSDMGDTVIAKFKKWSNSLADFTVLPKQGIWRSFLDTHPYLSAWLQQKASSRATKKRLKRSCDTMDPSGRCLDAETAVPGGANTGLCNPQSTPIPRDPLKPSSSSSSSSSTTSPILTPATLRTHIALSIRRIASDLSSPTPKRYTYEEWVDFIRLLRFASSHHTSASTSEAEKEKASEEEEEEAEGLVDWDWIGEDSPLIHGGGESEWLLGRLTEALVRVERRECGGKGLGVEGMRDRGSKEGEGEGEGEGA